MEVIGSKKESHNLNRYKRAIIYMEATKANTKHNLVMLDNLKIKKLIIIMILKNVTFY